MGGPVWDATRRMQRKCCPYAQQIILAALPYSIPTFPPCSMLLSASACERTGSLRFSFILFRRHSNFMVDTRARTVYHILYRNTWLSSQRAGLQLSSCCSVPTAQFLQCIHSGELHSTFLVIISIVELNLTSCRNQSSFESEFGDPIANPLNLLGVTLPAMFSSSEVSKQAVITRVINSIQSEQKPKISIFQFP